MFRYNVDEGQQAIRDRVAEFAGKHIEPVAKELDHRDDPDRFAFDIYRALGKNGFIGMRMPAEYGGGDKSSLEYATLIEELCFYDPAICLINAVPELATYPIYTFGTEEQKRKYVPKCVSGEWIPAFALTEPDAGSDAVNQKTTGVLEGDEIVINGEKIFIMHGDVADLVVVFLKMTGGQDDEKASRRISVVIMETKRNGKPIPGYKAATLKKKMGMRASTTGRLWFDNVRVPRENMLGEVGKGFKIAMNTLDGARIGVAAQGLGVAERAFHEAVNYAKKRICFGAPIARLQSIQWMIADMATRIEAGRLLTYKAAQLEDKGEKFTIEASQAKLYCSEIARFCVDRAMQIHAGYGYIGEFSIIEKLYRDQRIMEIYEGTSEIQRLVISGSYLR